MYYARYFGTAVLIFVCGSLIFGLNIGEDGQFPSLDLQQGLTSMFIIAAIYAGHKFAEQHAG